MRQTWRWFGPSDKISVEAMVQVGVEGVVSALHHIKPGEVWPLEEIARRQGEIAHLASGLPSGLAWEVVESLPVSEAIKTQTGDWREHITAYCHSLHNLAAGGLKTICYNFMPILDWTRTELRSPMEHGGTAMRFDLTDFALFDIHLLARPGAGEAYGAAISEAAAKRFAAMNDEAMAALQNNIVAGLPGANDSWTLSDVRALLRTYAEIDADQLRANLTAFLELVVPTAEKLGLRLCCHPDDPPFSLLGLPRIMSKPDDFATIMRAVDLTSNGITLCTGSLGIAEDIDFVAFIRKWGTRIHFAHLRNTRREGPSFSGKHSFFEAAHLEGDTDMAAVVGALLEEEARRKEAGREDWQIPMRPDHGQDLLDDLTRSSMPGYPLIGRMRGLAELRGLMVGLAAKTNG